MRGLPNPVSAILTDHNELQSFSGHPTHEALSETSPQPAHSLDAVRVYRDGMSQTVLSETGGYGGVSPD